LGANDEDIRKKIIETDNLMDHIVSGLQDPSPRVRLAAVRCLHSLSRSVQQLRTTFQVIVINSFLKLLEKVHEERKSQSMGPAATQRWREFSGDLIDIVSVILKEIT
jgi:hypothetical protein